ncbi:hypothetical protein EJ110_NYTH21391 [Nymphaea thermarum]|nr:hypothetical protein EJ110_NYTH21391 [Nymphaea thermarum]
MGNCIRIQSANPLNGDVSSDGYDLDGDSRLEAQRLIRSWTTGQLEKKGDGRDCGVGMEHGGKIGAATEVKIRITKKQLEELVRVDMHGMSLEQLLKKAAALGAIAREVRHRHWRPALQSIPELD